MKEQRLTIIALLVLLSSLGCKPRYDSSLADDGNGREEKFRTLSKVALMKSLVANGAVATNGHAMFNEMLDFAVNSKDDEVRQHVVSALVSVLQSYRFEEFEVRQTPEMTVDHSLEVGSKFGKGKLLSYMSLRTSESQCKKSSSHTPQYCFDYVSCLNVIDHATPFLTHKPEAMAEEVGGMINAIGQDIACLHDGLRKDIATYRYESLLVWKEFYADTNFASAEDGERPTSKGMKDGVKAKLKSLVDKAVNVPVDGQSTSSVAGYHGLIRKDLPEEMRVQHLYALAQERGAELDIDYGPAFELPSLTTIDKADFETQRTVLGTVKKFNDAMTDAYITNSAMYYLLGRADLIDPTPWLNRVNTLSAAWLNAYSRKEMPKDEYLYPKIAFKALQMFSHNEMKLPWGSDWYQTLHRVYNFHIPPERKQRALYAALKGADAQLSLSQTVVRAQLEGIGNGTVNLVNHQKSMAKEISGFHSLYFMLAQFAEAIDEYNRAQDAYKDGRSDLTPEERKDLHNPVNAKASAAGKKFQSIWLSYACLNYKYGTGSKTITLDSYKLQQQTSIGCWEKMGFDWYVFARAPYNNIRPFQCISDEGTISMQQVCGVGFQTSRFSMGQIYSQVGQCLQQQDNFRWCQGKSAIVAQRLADISAFVAAVVATIVAGPQAGFVTRSVLIALTATATRRAILAVSGLRPFRDESLSWADDWGKELALTTAMVMVIQPLIAANASLVGLSSQGGAGASSFLSSGTRFVGFHGLNVATFTGISYLTPQVAAKLYGKDPAELGADRTLSDRLWDAVWFEAIFASFHAGSLAVAHRAAIGRAARNTSGKMREFFRAKPKEVEVSEILRITGPAEQANNPALNQMLSHWRKTGDLNFDLHAVLGRSGGRRLSRTDLLKLMEENSSRLSRSVREQVEAVLKTEQSLEAYQAIRETVYGRFAATTSGKPVTPDFYSTVNNAMSAGGKQPLIPNAKALTPGQVAEATRLLKGYKQSLQLKRNEAIRQGQNRDNAQRQILAEMNAVEDALIKLPELTNAQAKQRFDANHLSGKTGDIEGVQSKLFQSLLELGEQGR